jgi:single-stranded-DNA-specific exonuclease
MATEIDPKFWENICRVSAQIAAEDDFLVVSHHDADGMTACAIMVDLLNFLGKDAEFLVLKQLDSTTIAKVKEKAGKTIVFTDMGSGQLSLLRKNGIENFYVVDHHPPEEEYDKQVNPNSHGYNGGLDISASGVTYLFAKSLGCKRMVHLAVVGAVGDMQDSDGKLHSINRILLEDGIYTGLLKVKQDLRLFGRQSRPLTQMLAYASDPSLPGLTGNEASCAAFIEGLGIPLKEDDRWRAYVDLEFSERNRLTSALYMRLLDHNIPEFIIQGMIGEVYTLLKEAKRTELRDAKEFASLLNACGRQEQPEVGVNVCLGDRETNWMIARDILQMHRKMLRDGITHLRDKGVEKDMQYIYYFDANNTIGENIIGVIAGMAYGAGIIPPDRPILAFANDKDNEEMIKVSGRANWNLVRGGLHLGNALREESRKYGGEGGGHDIAAGARILRASKQEFLKAMDEMIGRQLKRIK